MKYAITAAACGLAALCATAALAQPPAAPAPAAGAPAAARPPRAAPPPVTGEITQIPANLAPKSVQASVITVADLDVAQKWYETVLGMVKIQDVGTTERVMSMNPANPNAPAVMLAKGVRQPGAETYGRLILDVTNAKDTAAFLQTHGVATQQVLPNQAYFFRDFEGNQLEIYQPTMP